MASKKKRRSRRASASPPPEIRRGWRWPWLIGSATVLAAAALLVFHPWSHDAEGRGAGTAPASDATVFAAYAGSSSCRECHEQAYEHWANSHHALAERPIRSELDKPAFDPPRTFQHGSQSSGILLSGSNYEISSKDLSGKNEPQTVVRVIGVDPLRQFLVPASGGRFQAMEAAYDPHRNEWFDVYGSEDRQPGEWGHWTGRAMTWNSMCATCHNTRVRKNYDQASDTYHATMAEICVSCEACHGPMKTHVQWEQKYHGKDPNLRPLSRDQMLDVCGSCHSRRGELTGDFAPGDSFFDHYSLNIVDDSEIFYSDGQVHDEDYEFSAFLGSRMHAAGVRCVDCHEPHSGKTLLSGNALCMRCHAGTFPKAPLIDPIKHTFHRLDSAGSQCINCHMPQTTYMQRHHRHDHGFTTPDPLLTRQLGVPNACNRCHTDKSADWAIEASDRWYGSKLDRPARRHAQTIAAARLGNPSAKAGLLALLDDAARTPYWRAVASGLLAPWTGEPVIDSALLKQLSSDQPLVRISAARSLSPLARQDPTVAQAMQKLLSDPARGVRLAAAAALQDSLDPQSRAGREFARFLDQQSDQPIGQLQNAMYCIARKDSAQAIAHLQKAVEWDARSPTLRREVAVAYGILGEPAEAAGQLREACQLDPHNADYEYLLGLTYEELGQAQEGIEALEHAVQLDPHRARAWYNLGLARRNLGQNDAALDALLKAESANPSDPDVPYARATLLLQLGRVAEARNAAHRALQIRSDYAPAQQLLSSLSRP